MEALFLSILLCQPTQDLGDFVVVRVPLSQYAQMAEDLHQARYLETMIAEWNSVINLPEDIAVGFAECGQANAFFNREEVAIIMCLELLDYFINVFSAEVQNEDDLLDAALGAFTFTLHHELGHALVSVLDVPITGKEEDAVDQLSATVFLEDSDPEMAQPVLDAALWFLNQAEEQEASGATIADLPFFGEHSLSKARFYNLICWVYGSNPDAFADFVGDVIPEQRAVQCPREFLQFTDAWNRLLADHLK